MPGGEGSETRRQVRVPGWQEGGEHGAGAPGGGGGLALAPRLALEGRRALHRARGRRGAQQTLVQGRRQHVAEVRLPPPPGRSHPGVPRLCGDRGGAAYTEHLQQGQVTLWEWVKGFKNGI